MSVNIDSIIKSEQDRTDYRTEYNQRPFVKAKRTLYNQKRNGQQAAAAQHIKGITTKEEALKLCEELETVYDTALLALQKSFAPKVANSGQTDNR